MDTNPRLILLDAADVITRLSARVAELEKLLRAVQNAKQKPGISNGENSGSFNVILHGNWFIAASHCLPEEK